MHYKQSRAPPTDVVQTKRLRKHYTIKKKRAVLQAIKGKTEREAAWSEGIQRWTLNDWRKDEESTFAYEGSEKTLSRAPGCPETVPFSGELITFIKDARRDSEVLTAKTMACYVRDQYPEMLDMLHGRQEGRFHGL
ncbi:hypothetical protein PF005_g6529 [Phytophthora fragariae]|uniref:HTH psq-type domain-containing protein n=1 Tax=Phytophthora fragariae TaxID=53985 RepID=A0A6A3T0M2_9STRA|nr:hypothetical protein PF003_g27913 [Phytophthora fragariae]KAE8944342.1 hypothetical protein PF009_g5983 [Phytophthora fragariae]KAE9020447.1 hypothetical protein PF011_g5403 [Phytophthora fragariae]KAE9124949.1 hypothetical protein PF010_g5809 [Phytophthora fragariae]KAE9127293.1 hypothetical protein PF007_g5656 [Phytophthora fragariae]